MALGYRAAGIAPAALRGELLMRVTRGQAPPASWGLTLNCSAWTPGPSQEDTLECTNVVSPQTTDSLVQKLLRPQWTQARAWPPQGRALVRRTGVR